MSKHIVTFSETDGLRFGGVQVSVVVHFGMWEACSASKVMELRWLWCSFSLTVEL